LIKGEKIMLSLRDFDGEDSIVLKDDDLRRIDYHMEMIYKARNVIEVLADVSLESEKYGGKTGEGIAFSIEILAREFEKVEELLNKAINRAKIATAS
jgi:hypothetical protein